MLCNGELLPFSSKYMLYAILVRSRVCSLCYNHHGHVHNKEISVYRINKQAWQGHDVVGHQAQTTFSISSSGSPGG
jgi:hypothetical protein